LHKHAAGNRAKRISRGCGGCLGSFGRRFRILHLMGDYAAPFHCASAVLVRFSRDIGLELAKLF
jgi:hypothetical protein